jgi:hypothetical protein
MLAVLLGAGLYVFRRLFDRLLLHMDQQMKVQDSQIDVSAGMLKQIATLEGQLRYMDEKQQARHNDLLERLELRRTPIHGVPIQIRPDLGPARGKP